MALTTSIDGVRYAIATHRKSDGALTLVSGYVDVHSYAGENQVTKRGELLSTGLKELREELLPGRIAAGAIEVDAGMLVSRTARDVLKEVSFREGGSLVEHVDATVCFLGAPFSGSNRQEGDVPVQLSAESSWTVRPAPLPAYLLGLHPVSQVSVNGEPLEAGFIYDKCHDSGQIIFSLELELPAGSGVSLFHSETAPDGERPGWLKEVIDPRGIVLLRLDEAGFPDGSSYWLLDGALIERSVPRDQMVLSEFFAPCFVKEERPTGIVETSSIAFDAYRAAASSLA